MIVALTAVQSQHSQHIVDLAFDTIHTVSDRHDDDESTRQLYCVVLASVEAIVLKCCASCCQAPGHVHPDVRFSCTHAAVGAADNAEGWWL